MRSLSRVTTVARSLSMPQRTGCVESRVHSLGEIANLKPGQSDSLTLNLKAGTYMLFCNEPGHYNDGMYAKLVVAP